MVEYDLIVTGAGPAGSTAARHAALLGLSVLILDKARFPRTKPCAGGARFDVSELVDFDLSSVAQRDISGLSIFSPSGIRADLVPKDRSRPGITVMREEFDQLLIDKAAEAGATVIDDNEVIDVMESSSSVTVTTLDGQSYSSAYVIGADGINSRTAKQLGFYSGWKNDSASVTVEVEIEVGEEKVTEVCGEPGRDDMHLLLLYFGEFAHGYTWCFPKRSILSVGACCRQDKVKNIRVGFERWYSKFLNEHNIQPEIVSDTSARFPVLPAKQLVKGRALLVGDAAGLVDSFTGEGIPHAIQSGILAASAVKKAVENSSPTYLREYERDAKKEILEELKVTQSLAKLFYKNKDNMETLCRFFDEDEYAGLLIANAIGGTITKKEAKRKLTFRMLRKNPRGALSLYL